MAACRGFSIKDAVRNACRTSLCFTSLQAPDNAGCTGKEGWMKHTLKVLGSSIMPTCDSL